MNWKKAERAAITSLLWPPNVPVWEGEEEEDFHEVHAINVTHIGRVPVWQGEFNLLPISVQRFITHWVPITRIFLSTWSLSSKRELESQLMWRVQVRVMCPSAVWICDGSPHMTKQLESRLLELGVLRKLPKRKHWQAVVKPFAIFQINAVIQIIQLWHFKFYDSY